MRLHPNALALAGCIGAASSMLVAAPTRAAPFDITSSALQDGGVLAKKNAGNNPQNKNCNGENVSPPLAWANAVERTAPRD